MNFNLYFIYGYIEHGTGWFRFRSGHGWHYKNIHKYPQLFSERNKLTSLYLFGKHQFKKLKP